VKPLALMERLVAVAPMSGLVADPFAGSGTTCVAASRQGRCAIAIEISQEWTELARERVWAKASGSDYAGEQRGSKPCSDDLPLQTAIATRPTTVLSCRGDAVTNSTNDAPKGELILYQTEDGRTRIECRFEDESVWLTQALMAELFDIGVGTVNHHLKEIYAEGELAPEATIRRHRIVRTEGNRLVSRDLEYYSLEAILAVGFRVRSHRGTQFRRWANARLSEYLVKGFTMDDERFDPAPVWWTPLEGRGWCPWKSQRSGGLAAGTRMSTRHELSGSC
jgi:hypothetical protein